MEASKKEIQIYYAVFALAKSGRTPESLRVQEIADAAKMGKGTLYEYFDSKEEIIEKTMQYFMEQEIAKFLALLDKTDDFETIVRKGLQQMTRKECYSDFQVLFSNTERLAPGQFIEQKRDTVGALILAMVKLIDRLIEIGIAEGAVDPAKDRQYQRFAIFGAIAAYNLAARLLPPSKERLTALEDHAVEMIRNALGF